VVVGFTVVGVDGNGWGGTGGWERLAEEVGSPGGVVIFFSGVRRVIFEPDKNCLSNQHLFRTPAQNAVARFSTTEYVRSTSK
jgi:hypothetical protein